MSSERAELSKISESDELNSLREFKKKFIDECIVADEGMFEPKPSQREYRTLGMIAYSAYKDTNNTRFLNEASAYYEKIKLTSSISTSISEYYEPFYTRYSECAKGPQETSASTLSAQESTSKRVSSKKLPNKKSSTPQVQPSQTLPKNTPQQGLSLLQKEFLEELKTYEEILFRRYPNKYTDAFKENVQLLGQKNGVSQEAIASLKKEQDLESKYLSVRHIQCTQGKQTKELRDTLYKDLFLNSKHFKSGYMYLRLLAKPGDIKKALEKLEQIAYSLEDHEVMAKYYTSKNNQQKAYTWSTSYNKMCEQYNKRLAEEKKANAAQTQASSAFKNDSSDGENSDSSAPSSPKSTVCEWVDEEALAKLNSFNTSSQPSTNSTLSTVVTQTTSQTVKAPTTPKATASSTPPSVTFFSQSPRPIPQQNEEVEAVQEYD